MVNLFFKRIIFIKENTFISSGNTYCDVILNVDHLGFDIRQFFAHDLAPLIIIIIWRFGAMLFHFPGSFYAYNKAYTIKYI